MMNRLLPFFALVAFALVPFAIGVAEDKASTKEESNEVAVERLSPAASVAASECLASEEVIKDLESREKKIKQKEEALAEKEKELNAQKVAIKEEMNKLEARQGEIQTAKAKELAANEEKVAKLIETLETMSPKAAAAVIGGVDEELAVTALSRLTSVKAGKILSNLKNDKSSKLSELMAYGKLNTGKEKAHGESTERNPASKQ
jgi:flagellar motility protein MotE (MotC chaperone)